LLFILHWVISQDFPCIVVEPFRASSVGVRVRGPGPLTDKSSDLNLYCPLRSFGTVSNFKHRCRLTVGQEKFKWALIAHWVQ
jgi:hypothetical protein